MSHSQIAELTVAVQQLNKHLDERVKTIESWQVKADLKISQGGLIPAETRKELDTINAKLSAKIAEYKKLILADKEAKLAAQRPGYHGSNSGAFKHPATKAIEKWMRKGSDISALTPDERSYIDFNHMDYSIYPAEQKVLISEAADLGGFFAGTDLSDRFIQKLFLISPLRSLADTQTIGGEKRG